MDYSSWGRKELDMTACSLMSMKSLTSLDLTVSQNYPAFYLVSVLEEKNVSLPPDCQASFQYAEVRRTPVSWVKF